MPVDVDSLTAGEGASPAAAKLLRDVPDLHHLPFSLAANGLRPDEVRVRGALPPRPPPARRCAAAQASVAPGPAPSPTAAQRGARHAEPRTPLHPPPGRPC